VTRLALLLLLAAPKTAFAWGERGHNAIARIAAMRVADGMDEPALRDYFRGKALQLGHIANAPDVSWRKGGEEVEALNAPTHFSNADDWTRDLGKLPLDYSLAKRDAAAARGRSDGKRVDLFENGTVIWRAEQLFEKMREAYREAAAVEPGSRAFKAAVQRALVYGGLMAHFIGDAGQPYHNSVDHDGWGTGEGGIHSYFETAALNARGPDLEAKVYDKVPAAASDILERSGLDRKPASDSICGTLPAACLARALSAEAYGRIPEVRKADAGLVLEKSEGKKAAKRKSADEAAAAFAPLVEDQLALSAAALARLWREAWERGGRPDLSKAQSFEYALAPAFVEPDYDPEAIARVRTGRASRR
jgi:hypothetical protein